MTRACFTSACHPRFLCLSICIPLFVRPYHSQYTHQCQSCRLPLHPCNVIGNLYVLACMFLDTISTHLFRNRWKRPAVVDCFLFSGSSPKGKSPDVVPNTRKQPADVPSRIRRSALVRNTAPSIVEKDTRKEHPRRAGDDEEN